MNAYLQVQHLHKTYTSTTPPTKVLRDVSFTIRGGEFVALMGPSGSGKSTLLYTVSTMESIDEGEVYLGDQALHELSDDQKSDVRLKQMGFVFQQTYFLEELTIADNVLLPAIKAKKKSVEAIRDDAKELLKKMGILELWDRKITEISGGQLQRAGIARAVLTQPDLLFADEPTGALNQKASQEVLDELSRIHQEGMTILMVTHDQHVAARAERILYMCDGRIVSVIDLRDIPKGERDAHLQEKLLELDF